MTVNQLMGQTTARKEKQLTRPPFRRWWPRTHSRLSSFQAVPLLILHAHIPLHEVMFAAQGVHLLMDVLI